MQNMHTKYSIYNKLEHKESESEEVYITLWKVLLLHHFLQQFNWFSGFKLFKGYSE